jgi:hypothetical protein
VFAVTVSAGHTVDISVSEGAVLFLRTGRADVRVVAGSSWHPEPPAPPAEPLAPPMGTATPTVVSHDSVAAPDAVRAAAHQPARDSEHHQASLAPAPPSPVAPTAAEPSNSDEDAAYLGVVALMREGRWDEARVAGAGYLRRFPAGFRRAEIKQLVETPAPR